MNAVSFRLLIARLAHLKSKLLSVSLFILILVAFLFDVTLIVVNLFFHAHMRWW